LRKYEYFRAVKDQGSTDRNNCCKLMFGSAKQKILYGLLIGVAK